MDQKAARAFRDQLRDGTTAPTQNERYADGHMRPPFAPELAQEEHRALMSRSQWPACRMVVGSICQDLDVFGVHHPDEATAEVLGQLWESDFAPGFESLIRYGLTGGEAYSMLVPERRDGRSGWRVVVRRKVEVVAQWDDLASDHVPQVVATRLGRETIIWNGRTCWSIGDESTDQPVQQGATVAALLGDLDPVAVVTTGDMSLDLAGRPYWSGVVEPLIPAQDRLNQDTFDLQLVSSFGAVVLRYIAGVDLPESTDAAREHKIQMALDRIMVSANPDTRFGSVSGTPMEPYIRQVAAALGDFAVQAKVPPNRLLADIVNIGADTVDNIREGYEASLARLRRKIDRQMERALRARCLTRGLPDPGPEVRLIWRNTELSGLAGIVDAATKAHSIGMNAEALVRRLSAWRPDELNALVDGYQERRRQDLTADARSIVSAVTRAAGPTPTEPAAA